MKSLFIENPPAAIALTIAIITFTVCSFLF